FTLVVTDNENATGTGTLTINVQPNQPPTLTYANQTVTAGTAPAFLPVVGPSDNGAINPLALQSIVPGTGLTLSLNPASGQIAVTGATLIGSYLVTVTATDNCGATRTATLTVNVVCPTITLTPASLPSTPVNTAYAQSLSASPAGGNYSFAVTSGLLPAGLTLNSNGSFSGAPTNSGTFNFRVTATGFGGCTAFRDYSLVVTCPAIAVTPSSLPGGSVGTAYSQTVSATPAGSYAYGVSSGALPIGLTLNASTGAITGTPTSIGSYTFTITAAAGACSDSRTYTVVIGCSTITFSPASPLPAGQVGVAYNQTIGINPSGSYTLSLTSGSLPSGLTLNPATGVISGLPTTTGSVNFTVRALAGNGCEASQTYTLAMNCPTVVLTPAGLPNGSIGTPYSQTVAAAPAGGNYIYAVTTGNLPPGLNLNQATGVLSGTPTLSGTSNFTITATGFGGCAGSKAYSITVGGGGCPAITLPEIATSGVIGSPYNQSVTASPAGGYGYTLTGTLPPGVTFYNAAALLYGYPAANGTYNFTVTATDSNDCTGSRSYSITIGASFAHAVVNDFDGDGKSDLMGWFGKQSQWQIAGSADGKQRIVQWEKAFDPLSDVMACGDYDGDGKYDLGVFHRATGQWLINSSKDGATITEQWGIAGDVPVPADYDGDGKTDIAVWRESEGAWYIKRSSDGEPQITSWGGGGALTRDVPVPADYDGDGKADIAIFRQGLRQTGRWYIRQSSDGALVEKTWGLNRDVPVAADYDGDGKADIAVWRASDNNWHIARSSDGAEQTVFWGASWLGDVPVPGDYDGDGKTDVAVWRAGEGRWYVKCSLDGSVRTTANGQVGDTPITANQR
ncbi:MAG: putative Ig domain-containing protein, partial [Acidobacteriota bacterium]